MKRAASSAVPVKASPLPGAGKLKLAARLLWVVAILQMVVGAALIVHASEEVDDFIARLLYEKRVTIHQVLAAPAEKRAEYGFDQVRDGYILRFRLWHACDIAAGIFTAACALLLRRRPLTAVIFPAVLFFFLTAAKATFQDTMPLAMVFGRVAVLNVLLGAVVCVLAARKEQKELAAAT